MIKAISDLSKLIIAMMPSYDTYIETNHRQGRDRFGLWRSLAVKGVEQRFRWIVQGRFVMGSPEVEVGRFGGEKQHEVILTQSYWLAETACTQALWQAIVEENPSHFKGGQRPVESVSFEDIKKFLAVLNTQQAGFDCRLPSEAEWEFACRAGTQTTFSWGTEIDVDKANYCGTWEWDGIPHKNSVQQTTDVKGYPPNEWGLYEMHGNVWEWCTHYDGEDYPARPVSELLGPEEGVVHVVRGGGWDNSGRDCRAACRRLRQSSLRNYHLGFRLASPGV